MPRTIDLLPLLSRDFSAHLSERPSSHRTTRNGRQDTNCIDGYTIATVTADTLYPLLRKGFRLASPCGPVMVVPPLGHPDHPGQTNGDVRCQL